MPTDLMTKVAAKFEGVEADISTIGTSLVLLAVGVMGFRWIKAQFF